MCIRDSSNSDSGDVSDNNGEFSNDGEISATPGTRPSRLIKNSIRTISKQSQTIVCNVHEYAVNNKVGKGSITETAKIVKLSRPTVRKRKFKKSCVKSNTEKRRW